MSLSIFLSKAWRPSGAVALLALGACTNDILNVQNPDVVKPGDLANAAGAQAQRNGAIQDFTVAFSGTQDGFVMMTGNMADELQATDTFADRQRPNERATDSNLGGAVDQFYRNLHLARAGLIRAAAAWQAAKPSSKDTLSELYAIRGFTENFFAEAYCSGVPFSADNGSTTTFGEPQTTAQILARATASFDTALSNATLANLRNVAAVGRARTLLNLGQFAQAATAVAGVPTAFRYQVFHSTSTARQNNGVWNGTYLNGSRYVVANNEGTNGYNFLSTPADPRTPWTPTARVGFDNTSRDLPRQEKYFTQSSAATLADGIEARLIELEARLQGGTQADRDALFAGLNTLRATAITPAMPALAAAPTTQAAAVDQLFRERGAWLWLTGHRLGDMRRLVRQYARPAASVFPVGPVILRPGVQYGTDVNFVIPFDETNNPKFKACIDRNA